MASKDEQHIKRCIELARMGSGNVSPNPLVGCVIVKKDKIIGEGYHKEYGKEHAEVNAIKNAKMDVSGATVYVNLEPCVIFGKTPPCTDLLISKKISKVVCGTLDPNPNVNGKGLLKLKRAGIKIESGILKNECIELNEKFFKYIKTGIPFITLKIAQTLDSKISNGKKGKNKITSIESRTFVHRLRTEHDAILVGSNTIVQDNPDLTIRHVKGRQPYRVILNSSLNISLKAKVLTDEFTEKTIIITSFNTYKDQIQKVEKIIRKGARVYPLKTGKNCFLKLKDVLKLLGNLGISSVLIEGGGKIFSSFISESLVDKLLIFISPKVYGKGVETFNTENFKNNISLEFSDYKLERIGNDALFSINVNPKKHNYNF
jgi:diaminohydroxyphosphoribosylaminopyrimidine deaminase/5-amino-6-(5-phosphoribosylamino)uracil reductase